MSKIMAKLRKSGKTRLALLFAICAASAVGMFFALGQGSSSSDTDRDGICNDYENFFSVNYTNPAGPALSPTNAMDAVLDFDADGLDNLHEFMANTDPFNPDTDGDLFPDGTDADPVSRANLKWGDIFWLTVGGEYNVRYAQPKWLVGAGQDGGTFQTNFPNCWYVAPQTPENTGTLSIMVDRTMLTNNAVLKVKLFDSTNSTLYVDLLDTNDVVVAANVAGNILAGSASIVTTNIIVPLKTCPAAVSISLRRGKGEIAVYESLVYIDQDGDGLDESQEAQIGTSDLVPNAWPSYVKVNNGSGSGWYVPGKSVAVAANPAPTGDIFNAWTGDTSMVADIFAAGTTVTVPGANAAITPAYNVVQPAQGTILREVYTGISGATVSTLTGNTAFPNRPTLVENRASFECPTNWADSYGTRMRGYIHPPTSGSYTFWVASDDCSQLWLSSDDNPSNKVLVASVSGATAYRQWTKYPSQVSAPVHLEAGRKYYIEALHKENNSFDNLSVAWAGPGISQSIIDGAYLSPINVNYPPYAKLAVSTNLGLVSTPIIFSAAASTDPESGPLSYSWTFGDGSLGSGVSNAHAYASAGTYTACVTVADNKGASSSATGVVQIVTVHLADNPTNVVSGIEYKFYQGVWTNLPNFGALTPVRMGTTTNFNLNPRLTTINFGFQFTGFIQVPTNGVYTFYSNSDDGSALYVGSQQVVANDGVHAAIEKSGMIWLNAGLHAVTVVMFQNANSSYTLTVSYAGPGITKRAIPPAVLYRQTHPVTLTVNNGTGSGVYEPGWTVPIMANPAPSGMVFAAWMGSPNVLAGLYTTNTQVTMPNGDVTVAVDYMTKGSGTILREVYTGITGSNVASLTGNPAFPNLPTTVNQPTLFEAPQNWADNYGTRMRGYLSVPVTGAYTFWLAADENGQLWLSSNEDPANKAMIASVPSATGYRVWTNFPSQMSIPVNLEGHKRYYIEALQKESTGKDNLSVAWQGPGIIQNVITGAYLSPVIINYAPVARMTMSTNLQVIGTSVTFSASSSIDPEGGPLSYAWDFGDGNTSVGVSTAHAFAGTGTFNVSLIVTDNQGANSLAAGTVQIVSQRDPENPPNTVSGLEYKYYEGTWSNLPDYNSLSPVRMGATTNFNLGPALKTTNFGLALAGYIQVPCDGLYTFYTKSDDGSKLYIGNQLVVTNDGIHTMTEKFGSIRLKAGMHAVSVVIFQSTGSSGLTVSYAGPGIVKQVVPSSVLFRLTNPVNLTVNNGVGGGAFEPGWTVNISANPSPTGMVFDTWSGERVHGIYAANTYVTMPATDVTVTANFSTFPTGSILREVWTNVTGAVITNLANSYYYPEAPSFWGTCSCFEAPTNSGNNYGTRMRGFVYPPVTGDYTFFIASDDYGQLWLSPDGDPSNKTLIAWLNGASAYRQWTKSSTQKSAPIHLETGRRYYIEGLQKQSTGPDNLSVAWTGALGAGTNVIDGLYLSPIAIDTDNNGLRDAWELKYFGAIGQDPNADPDHDGLTNLQESKYNTNPFNADTDGDGMPDKWEIDNGLNPLSAGDAALDYDNDGLTNLQEYQRGTNPRMADTDGDGLSDGAEVNTYHTDPKKVDTDGDGLSDADEVNIFGTNPLLVDSNSNGIPDMVVIAETNGVNTSSRQSWHITSYFTDLGTSLLVHERYQDGRANYDFAITNADMYALQVQLSQDVTNQMSSYTFNVEVTFDGLTNGTLNIPTVPNVSANGLMVTPWLMPGTHTVGLRLMNGLSAVIEKVRICSVDGSDTNHNGIQDWKEAQLARGKDTDGDGISDLNEVTVYHTDPLKADTDGDGLSDSAELALGTNPLNADTDGDGMTDGEEVNQAKTNPLKSEFNGTVTDVDAVNGCQTNSATGVWSLAGTEIIARARRGSLSYTMTAPATDMYRILVEATHDWQPMTCTPVALTDTSDIMIYVDGEYLGKQTLKATVGIYSDVRTLTPLIGPGPHKVMLFWENLNSRIELRVRKLRLQSLGGPDSNHDGIKDWVQESVRNTFCLDTGTTNVTGPLKSHVSPACLEGAARYVDTMALSVASGTNIPVMHGAGDRWYANLPLTGASTPFTVSFMNGAVCVATNMLWTPLNLLSDSNIILRCNDQLLLTAQPTGQTNGTVTINISTGSVAVTSLVTAVTAPVSNVFAQPGQYTVSGVFSNGTFASTGSVLVTVVGGSFPTNMPAFEEGQVRLWSCPDMPSNVVLQSDSSVVISGSGTNLSVLMNAVNGDHYMVARTSTNGAILASTKLNAFWVQASVESYVWVIQTYPDGSQLIEQHLIMKNLPPDVTIEIKPYIAGVTFDDLTTDRWISAADFSDIGEYTFRLIKAASVTASCCHTVKMYQNGVFIGEAYYNGIFAADE